MAGQYCNPFSCTSFAQSYEHYSSLPGTSFLIDILQQSDFDIRQLNGVSATASTNCAPTG